MVKGHLNCYSNIIRGILESLEEEGSNLSSTVEEKKVENKMQLLTIDKMRALKYGT